MLPHLPPAGTAEGSRSRCKSLDLRCTGLDVHKQTVVACVLITHPDGQVHREVRTFSTMTAELLVLADWLAAQRVTHVALESTGLLETGV